MCARKQAIEYFNIAARESDTSADPTNDSPDFAARYFRRPDFSIIELVALTRAFDFCL